jgi:hypothetical protein
MNMCQTVSAASRASQGMSRFLALLVLCGALACADSKPPRGTSAVEDWAGAGAVAAGSGGSSGHVGKVRTRRDVRPIDTSVRSTSDAGDPRSDDAGAAADAGENTADGDTCPAQPRPVSGACTVDADCGVVMRTACCAPTRITGVRADAVETHLQNERCRPPCGLACSSPPTITDDGLRLTAAGYSVACVSGQCRTQARGDYYDCGGPGNTRCNLLTEYCFSIGSGVPNDAGPPGYSCYPRPADCSSCACLIDPPGGCACRLSVEGGPIVSCSAP